MTVRKVGRRFFLMGAGGAMLAVPALNSLLPSSAKAQEPAAKRMVAFMSDHGGARQPDMFPDESMASASLDHPVHQSRAGTLRAERDGADAWLSPVLRASADRLSDSLVGKMNVVRGLDVPFYYGHARHITGSYGPLMSYIDVPSLMVRDNISSDQVLARSSVIYPSEPRLRTMTFDRMGVTYNDPAAGEGGGFRGVEQLGPRAMFDAIYVESPDTPPEAPTRSPLDAIHESYARLESGRFGPGARLGTTDRRRLTQYMDLLSGIEDARQAPIGASCGDVRPIEGLPGEPELYSEDNFAQYNSLIIAAFMCDSSRIATGYIPMNEWGGVSMSHDDWHATDNRVGGGAADNQADRSRQMHQTMFSSMILDLVNRMDAVSEGDGTMLDNSLVWWSPESGSATHHGDSIPVISFGSVGGALQTGQYLDFRNRAMPEFSSDGIVGQVNAGRHPGVSYFQWTTTYLDAFGVPREEWAPSDRVPFSRDPGSYEVTDIGAGWNRDAMAAACSQPLPGLLR